MTQTPFIAQLKEELETLKRNGQTAVSVDALLGFLGNANVDQATKTTETIIEEFRQQNETDRHNARIKHDQWVELMRAAIGNGQAALKSIFFLNGGATLALLAFIGHLADVRASAIPAFAVPLTTFAWGAFCATTATAGSYLGQFFYSDYDQRFNVPGHVLNVLTILFGAIGLILFVFGVSLARTAFTAFSIG